MPELDGVRGIAILLVLAFHSAKGVADFGWMGVDLFFVLSGYLITRGLLETRGDRHYFRNFYAKRALRIWPLYYLLMVTVFWGLPAATTGIIAGGPVFWPFALYIQNLVYPGAAPGHLSATWSLAIEEQFYLAWPLAVALLSRQGLRRVSAALVLAAPVLRWKAATAGVATCVIYQLTYCRFDALAIGAWLAAAPPVASVDLERRSTIAALVGGSVAVTFGIVLGSSAVTSAMTPPARPAVEAALFSLVAIGSVGLVGLAVSRASRAGRVLRMGWLRYLGKISYGIYIYHVPIFLFVMHVIAERFGPSAPIAVKVLRSIIEVGVTLLVASVSWRVLERPLLRLKSRL